MINKIKIDGEIEQVFIQDNNSTNTLIMLHGMNSSSDFANDLYPLKHNFNIISINLPGSKYNSDKQEVTMEKWFNYACKMIKRVKNTNLYLLSHSMSGGIASMIINQFDFKKCFFFDTIHPLMNKSKAHNVLRLYHQPKNILETAASKIIGVGVSQKRKTNPWIDAFTSKDSIWYQMLNDYVLDDNFLKQIGENIAKKNQICYFAISSNDDIINTIDFVEYAISIKRPCEIIGTTHNPFKVAPDQVNNYLNRYIPFKKRSRFFKKKIFIA